MLIAGDRELSRTEMTSLIDYLILITLKIFNHLLQIKLFEVTDIAEKSASGAKNRVLGIITVRRIRVRRQGRFGVAEEHSSSCFTQWGGHGQIRTHL